MPSPGRPLPHRRARQVAYCGFPSQLNRLTGEMEQHAARKQGHWAKMAPKHAVAVFAVFCGFVIVARATYGALGSSGLQPLVQQPGCPKANTALLASAVDETSAGEARSGLVLHRSQWCSHASAAGAAARLKLAPHSSILTRRLQCCDATKACGLASVPRTLAAIQEALGHCCFGR